MSFFTASAHIFLCEGPLLLSWHQEYCLTRHFPPFVPSCRSSFALLASGMSSGPKVTPPPALDTIATNLHYIAVGNSAVSYAMFATFVQCFKISAALMSCLFLVSLFCCATTPWQPRFPLFVHHGLIGYLKGLSGFWWDFIGHLTRVYWLHVKII